jgi:ArsR family transcriptional regulator, arsenate/arsenite/antimonite-responsive transcriptional repressor
MEVVMRDVMDVAKALGDENRVRALMALDGRDLCVCQITALLDLAPSTVSKHMSILRQARLVESRKDGRWIYYRLADEEATDAAREAMKWLREQLERDRRIRTDRKRLREILRLDPEALCRVQTRERLAQTAAAE